MHEEALLRDLRRRLVELALAERAAHIPRVTLWVGALSHASEESLRARWPTTVAGTPAEGSELLVEASTDVDDPRASGIVLLRVDVSDEAATRPGTPGRAAQEAAGRRS